MTSISRGSTRLATNMAKACSVPYGTEHALAMFVANLVLPRDMEVKVAASEK